MWKWASLQVDRDEPVPLWDQGKNALEHQHPEFSCRIEAFSKKNPVEMGGVAEQIGVCNRTGSYKESRATLPADPSRHWRKANRGNGVKCIKRDTNMGSLL